MFQRLHMFAVVVEQKSLNRASRILNISQPALSRHIRGLEDELGAQIFERVGKRLELTPIGQFLYQFALEERQLERRFQQEVAKYRTGRRSTITIGASLTTLQSTLPDLISNYSRSDPETDIKAVTGKTHEIVQLVRERRVDVGLVASAVSDPSFHSSPLFDDHLCLVVPRNHPLSSKTALRIEELDGLPMILFSKGTWYRILTDELFERYDIRPEIKMEIDSFEAIVRLLPVGPSATLLPKSYLRDSLLKDNELLRINIDELKKTVRTTTIIYPDSGEMSPAAQRFVVQARLFYAK